MKDIAIFGKGGYGQEMKCLIDAINRVNPEWNFIGYFDDAGEKGEKVFGGELLGNMDDLNSWDKNLNIVISIGIPSSLYSVASRITNPKVSFPNLVAPDVTFHNKESVKMGKGNVIFFHSIISLEVEFGDFNLLNNGVYVGHNTKVDSYNIINPSSRISGNVEIGEHNFLGVGCAILQGIKIGKEVKVSAGSYIFRNTKDGQLYMGNPASAKVIPRINK
jgi:sugar O-acyltransferase (sialic acid O-acetyltransferase NeuD family)